MNIQLHQFFFHHARIFAVLLVAIFPVPALRAQPTEQTVQNHFLFIFETSRDMKLRVEAEQKALNTMLATSLNGQLHADDSMGVWTFGQDLRPRDYPLQNWNPDKAVMIASSLVKFLGKQHYAKSARLEALQPVLNEVARDSERLTVLIFCDGETKFSGTPFDSGINQIFAQKLGEQKKERQPFVIVLRSQLGRYIGYTVGLPPLPPDYPQFPPLPAPAPPSAPKTSNSPPAAPVIVGSPLIIIGTKISSSPPPKLPPTNPPPTALTNADAAPPANSVPTNLSAQTAATTNVAATVVLPTVAAADSYFLPVGAGLLGTAVVVGIFVRLHSRRKDASLITRSMNRK